MSGFFVVTLKSFFAGSGVAVGLTLDLGVAVEPSFTVTLIFWPGCKFSIPTFALFPEVDGLMAREDFVGEGLGVGCEVEVGAGDGLLEAFGVGVGSTVGLTVGLTVGFGVGLGETVADGDGVGVGAGVIEGEGAGAGVGETEGEGVGEGIGVTTAGAGADPPPDGAGVDGAKYVTCSGVIGSEIVEGAEGPTDVTVVTVNVYGVPFVNP